MSILQGPVSLLKGARVLAQHRELIKFSLIPAIIVFVVSLLGFFLSFYFGDRLLGLLIEEPEQLLLKCLWIVFSFILKLGAAFICLLITPWLIMLFGFPLCEPLAKRIDQLLNGQEVDASFSHEMLLTFTTTAGLLIIGLAGSVLFWLLGLIPGPNLLAGPFAAFIWTPAFFALDVIDSSLSRRQWTLRQKLHFLLRHPTTSISLGLCASILLSIPVLNLFVLPVVVAAGVITVRDLEQKQQL